VLSVVNPLTTEKLSGIGGSAPKGLIRTLPG
jgi:hypothetical protein